MPQPFKAFLRNKGSHVIHNVLRCVHSGGLVQYVVDCDSRNASCSAILMSERGQLNLTIFGADDNDISDQGKKDTWLVIEDPLFKTGKWSVITEYFGKYSAVIWLGKLKKLSDKSCDCIDLSKQPIADKRWIASNIAKQRKEGSHD